MEKMFRFSKKHRVKKTLIDPAGKNNALLDGKKEIDFLKLNGSYETEKVVVEWDQQYVNLKAQYLS